jgi:hypothetical protein
VNRETERFEAAVAQRLAKLHQEKLEAMGNGVDADAYRTMTGYVRALKDALGIMDEERKKIDKD